MRGLRSQLSELIFGLAGPDMAPMRLGLSHSLSRHKLKISPDKVDTMIVHAIGLLDDLDKELNTYAMTLREWYGWHFPELAKLVQGDVQFAKVVKLMGARVNAVDLNFSGVRIFSHAEVCISFSHDYFLIQYFSTFQFLSLVATLFLNRFCKKRWSPK